MSSPLSSLGKFRRTPLPESQNHRGKQVPFKPNPYSDDEVALLNDILSPGLAAPSAVASDGSSTSRSKATLHKSSTKGSSPNDFELMSTMMQKLTQLEQRAVTQAQDIKQKDKKIAVLEEKLKILQKSKEGTSTEPSKTEELERTCLQLQNQVWEMEQFLNDYGMVWIGDKRERRDVYPQEEDERREKAHNSSQHLWQPGRSVVKDFRMDFNLVQKNIRDLNVLAGEGEAHVKHTVGGARLERHAPIPLTLFQNGILMFNGPFRSYEEPTTQQCMQDIMDGYFPTELQNRFPDGVPFQLSDKRDVVFRERQRWGEFPGAGQAVGSRTGPASDPASQPVQETSHLPGHRLSVGQFLNKLPKSVIKEGKVIDIRGAIEQNLQGSSSSPSPSVILIETPSLVALKERLEVDEKSRPATAKDVSTLRVKSEDGEQTFILKMHFSETIGQLRAYLNQHRGEEQHLYDIVSSFPQQRYSDDSKTLRECGLVPNATLLLRNRNPS
ncbi:UBX domain-containing protein 11-like [Acipenser ruthenus]|uniref:UBX domain-containing protein 11-like n=1 Tax=Acipenser ruthenus TaxID=7906 RepID=UPI00145BE675|nr:UBX domain-containing protein 11-like [Acipenser ruthenus]XP_058856491.1 UBX domain-containing protein 11-like [Acipenser ruthenus]